MNKEFYRGEIFYIRNESEYSGNVQGGGRPAVIISNDIGNNAAPILEGLITAYTTSDGRTRAYSAETARTSQGNTEWLSA